MVFYIKLYVFFIDFRIFSFLYNVFIEHNIPVKHYTPIQSKVIYRIFYIHQQSIENCMLFYRL